MSLIPKLTPSILEQILEHLPSPSSTKVQVQEKSERIDYSALQRQIQLDHPYLQEEHIPNPEAIINFESLDKYKLLQLYRQFYLGQQQLEGVVEGYDPNKTELEIKSIEWDISKDDLREYKIPCEEAVSIRIRPDKIEIAYYKEEPAFITKIREALAKTESDIELKITVKYKHQH